MSRWLRVSVVWALVVLALVPAVSTFGQESSPVTADKEAWWGQVPVETVPDGAIAVGAAAGQADKVAALGIVLDAARGSTVERFTLTMKEAEDTGAQQGAAAAIIACPVIDFFSPAENGAFADAPASDCEAASVEGTRNDDGTWTFDLKPIADVWLDPFGTINPNGIRFDPTGTGTFQVSLTGMEDAAFDVSVVPAQEDADPFDASTTTVPGGFTGTSSSSSGSGDFATAPPPPIDAEAGDPTATTTVTPTTAPAVDDEAATAAPAANRAGDTSGNLPGGLPVVLLLAAAVGLLIAWHLGPAGRAPHAKIQRSGGVSRALAARTPSPRSTGASS